MTLIENKPERAPRFPHELERRHRSEHRPVRPARHPKPEFHVSPNHSAYLHSTHTTKRQSDYDQSGLHNKMAVGPTNPLLATEKPSDSLSIKLHPLVLLTISDFITRHTLRGQQGPIVGAIIGQQNGREVTMEYAFECNLKSGEPHNGQERIVMDEGFFATRLDQC